MYKSSGEKCQRPVVVLTVLTLFCVQVWVVTDGAVASSGVKNGGGSPGEEHRYAPSSLSSTSTWNGIKIKKKAISASGKVKMPSPPSSSSSSSFSTPSAPPSTSSSSTMAVSSSKPKYLSLKPSALASAPVPKYNNFDNYNHRHEPQWIHGIDQMQIESRPKGHFHGVVPYPISKGYDLTTLLAVSLVSAFLGALTFSIVDNGQRSMGNMFSLMNLIDAETVGKVLSSLGDWEEKLLGGSIPSASSPFKSSTKLAHQQQQDKDKDKGILNSFTVGSFNFTNKNMEATTTSTATPVTSTGSIRRSGRRARETQASVKTNPGLLFKWIQAYKKDPVELRCIQRLICQSLANSTCAARSINSDVGGTIMNMVMYFVSSAGEITEMIKDTVGNPAKCQEIAPYEFCDSDSSSSISSSFSSTSTTTQAPLVTMKPVQETAPGSDFSSIVPRLRRLSFPQPKQ